MNISMDKKYTLFGKPFTVLTVTKPGNFPVLGHLPDGALCIFTLDGNFKYGTTALVEVSPYADFVIDEPVMIRDHAHQTWERRHFAGVNVDGKASAWNSGATKWTTHYPATTWLQCRRPTAEELAE